MSKPLQSAKMKPPGTILLEEFEESLPKFDSLDEYQQLEFSKAIHMIRGYYKISDRLSPQESLTQAQIIVAQLKQLHEIYIAKNPMIASAIIFVIAHIESFYLSDPDAKLVHDLTGLYLYNETPLTSVVQALEKPEARWRRIRSFLVPASVRAVFSMHLAAEDFARSVARLMTRFVIESRRITTAMRGPSPSHPPASRESWTP